jgi:hypothetical protein
MEPQILAQPLADAEESVGAGEQIGLRGLHRSVLVSVRANGPASMTAIQHEPCQNGETPDLNDLAAWPSLIPETWT